MSNPYGSAVSHSMAHNVPGLGEGGEYEELKLRNVIKLLEIQKPGGKRMNAKIYFQTLDAAKKSLCFQTRAEPF